MQARALLGSLLAVGLCGCGGGVDVSAMLQDFDRYETDIESLAGDRGRAQALEAGREKRAEAGALAERGKGREALPIAERALADARLALETERMTASARRAESCRLQVEQARTKWREALFVLEQTEAFVGRKAPISRREPGSTRRPSLLPPTTLEPDAPPPASAVDASAQWTTWRRAARERKVAAADLENAFEHSYARARGDAEDEAVAGHHTYLAGRAVQSLECRVRAEMDERVCLEAAELTAELGDARANALSATLDLERELQGSLRSELDQLRAEAKSRQDELFDALSQMEGKFASIRRDARGTIVSLADILFDFDKATLRRAVEFNLVKIATILNQFGEMNILIEGHTDAIGTDEYNLDLSRRRAETVYEFLVTQDVQPKRMSWEGYGEARPVADNGTEEGRQRNRRVDLVIQDAP